MDDAPTSSSTNETVSTTVADTVRVRFVVPDPRDCLAGCSHEEIRAVFSSFGVDPDACPVTVRLPLRRDGTVERVELLRPAENEACNNAARSWAEGTRWEAKGSRPPVIPVQAFGSSASTETPSAAMYQTMPGVDPEKHGLLLVGSGGPDPGTLAREHGAEPPTVVTREILDGPGLCVMGRGASGVELRVLRDGPARALVERSGRPGSDVEAEARALAPDLEMFAAGALEGPGSCYLVRDVEHRTVSLSDSLRPRCVEGCSKFQMDRAFTRADLPGGTCGVMARMTIEPDGRVRRVELTRRDENERCNETMVQWARSTRWNAYDGEHDRYLSIGQLPPEAAGPVRAPSPAEPHMLSAGSERDPDLHQLFVHPDPKFDWEEMTDRFSRFTLVERLDRIRSNEPLLCAIGDTPDGVELRSRSASPAEATLSSRDGFEEIMRAARRSFPGLDVYVAEILGDGGTCMLLRPE